MKVTYLFTIVAFLLICVVGNSQSNGSTDKWSHGIRIDKAYRFANNGEWSQLGISYTGVKRIDSSYGFLVTSGYLRWKDSDMTSVNANLGAYYRLVVLGAADLVAFGSGGAVAVVGNDYGSIFAIVESGIQFLPMQKSISAALSWKQSLAFHPDHFSYLNASVGYMF